MSRSPIHALFERVFGGTDGAAKSDGDARLTACLSARLDDQRDTRQGELSDSPERSSALMAAYLDGGLDEAAQQDLHARLSRSPAVLHEVSSFDAFMDVIAAAQEAAPADLITSTIERSRTAKALTPPTRRSFAHWKWSGIAVAMAVAAIAVLVIINRQILPTDTPHSLTATAGPNPAQSVKIAEPQGAIVRTEGASQEPPSSNSSMVPAGAALRVPVPQDCKVDKQTKDNGGRPVKICPKKASGSPVAPAVSPDPGSLSSSYPAKPAMAPEGYDTMPGRTTPHH